MGINQIKNVIRKGRISAIDAARCRAKVVFDDKDGLVSAWLPVVVPFSDGSKGYWIPEVGTPVVCIFALEPSGHGLSDGFIIGSYYDGQTTPAEGDATIRSVRFPDGSYVRYDHGDIEIHATGDVVITGANVRIN